MLRLYLPTCLLLLAMFSFSTARANPASRVAATTASQRAAYRETIRKMPLLHRPNRPGHFYGNAIRRLSKVRFNGR